MRAESLNNLDAALMAKSGQRAEEEHKQGKEDEAKLRRQALAPNKALREFAGL